MAVCLRYPTAQDGAVAVVNNNTGRAMYWLVAAYLIDFEHLLAQHLYLFFDNFLSKSTHFADF